jgi:hypothetical protein
MYGITLWAEVLPYLPPLEIRNTLRLVIQRAGRYAPCRTQYITKFIPGLKYAPILLNRSAPTAGALLRRTLPLTRAVSRAVSINVPCRFCFKTEK